MESENNNGPSDPEGDFVRLLLRHENALRAFARSLLPHWDAVDEVVQDAGIVMWQKFEQLEDESGFLPWGKVIVRFHCYRYHERSRKREATFSQELLDLLAAEAEQIGEKVHDDRRRALESCLQEFAPPQRELLLAPYLHHGRISELAESQNISANALYKKLGRLRKKLRDCVNHKFSPA